ncbi:MAG: universal stress protein [Candidatus Methanoperedens sp.]|nr:universal stress protein [Candidatus Methanoperedens sp.]MCZ7368963.1 universal stress protein [Candidatus Methanoperedens sp.]
MEKDSLWEFENILIPLDGSKISENALKYGVSIAGKYGAGIVLVSVFSSKDKDSLFKKRIQEMNPKLAGDISKMPLTYLMQTYHEILKKAIVKQKISVKSVLRDERISAKTVVNVLKEAVNKEKIDLVIMSSHGKSGFKRPKMGSITEELLKNLEIPVLLVEK